MRAVAVVCVVLSLSACRPESRGRADAADHGGDDYCEDYHCYGEVSCRDDKAHVTGNEAIPCHEWDGSCPSRTVTCAEGCDLPMSAENDFDDGWWDRVEILCAETPAAQVGDPCANDCLPTRAVADATGAVTQTYLSCDFASRTCAAAEPPLIESYLAPCPETAAAHAGPGVSGISSAAPDTGPGADALCLVAWDETAQAMRHGMTVGCIGDWQCPEGASCDASLATLPADDRSPGPVCRPGARGAPLVEHLPPRS